MAKTKFFKVSTLPGTLEANSFYFVENGTYAESYVTNSAGVARSIGNSSMINALIDQKLSGLNALEIVADITERDALSLTANAMVLVTDASDDSTVDSGAALYAYKHADTSFTKVSEYESMDAVISWTNISGRPTSTPSQIDSAVANSHTHANKTQLDKIDEDADGEITYNGESVRKWDTTNW